MPRHLRNWDRLAYLALALVVAQTAATARTVSGSVTAPQGGAIAGAVVFMQVPAPPPGGSRAVAVVDQVEKTFVPGLLPIMVGTSVRFPNHDQIQHHVYSFSPTKTFELPLYKGEYAPPVLFDKVGVVKIGCNIHDWMSGIILVLPTPHFAVTDAAGDTQWRMCRKVTTHWSSGTQSNVKPEETARQIEVREDIANVNFTLNLSPARMRPAVHGSRADP